MSTQAVERPTLAELRGRDEEYPRENGNPYAAPGERIRRKLVREHRDRAKQFVGKMVEAEYKPNWPAYRRWSGTKWIMGRVEKIHVYDGNVRYKINGQFIPRDSLVTWIVSEEA